MIYIFKLQPLLEWIVLIALAVGLGLGLAWLPLEKSVVQIGFLVVGGSLLVYTFYLILQLSQLSDDDENSNWPVAPDEISLKPEVKP